jgi:hypothetical protein
MRKFQAYNSLYRVVLSLLFLCWLMQGSAWAQEQALLLPETSGESIILSCDREIYGSGEQIHYLTYYNGPEEFKSASWSTVLYVELISWDGTKQASSKILIDNGGVSGKIGISENIPSGVYYLRAYTKWMRNYSPISYTYLPLKILNPHSPEMLASPMEGETNLQAVDRVAASLADEIVWSGLKDQYGTREQVEFEIQLPEALISGSYSLGIAKTLSQSSGDYTKVLEHETEKGQGKIEFLPEINGLTLSGAIIDSESSAPVANARLQLSSYSDPFLYAEVLSGKDGSFLFALPHFTGNPELHIAEATDSLVSHKILLASEFCNKPVHLPYIPLQIDSTEQSVVKEILVNTQLKARYEEDAVHSDNSEGLYPAFYGNGASLTYVRDYIELSDLREFIYEIIPQVSISSNGNGSFITIQGPSCMDIYPPLILMDNIQVPNNEELLNIPSKRIERIEVLNKAYMVGNTRYSGILSIYSTKKDMSGVAQEGEHHFFNLHMLDDEDPGFEHTADPMESSFPDIRNLLYWEPSVSFSEEGTFRVTFSTPDSPGKYVLTLRGTDPVSSGSVLGKALILVK